MGSRKPAPVPQRACHSAEVELNDWCNRWRCRSHHASIVCHVVHEPCFRRETMRSSERCEQIKGSSVRKHGRSFQLASCCKHSNLVSSANPFFESHKVVPILYEISRAHCQISPKPLPWVRFYDVCADHSVNCTDHEAFVPKTTIDLLVKK